jgi:hypothetical protein
MLCIREWLHTRGGAGKELIEPFAGGGIVSLTAACDLVDRASSPPCSSASTLTLSPQSTKRCGNLLLWSAEQAEKEHKRAEALAAKLRSLGVDPDQ